MRTGYLYPWDVVGDAGAPARIAGSGFPAVALACAYHGVRAATPRHPSRRLLATPAALHRPGALAVPPGGPAWTDDPDPVATAADALTAAGVAVLPWIVLTHSSTVGAQRPDWTAVSPLGDRHPWALCPSHDGVRAHAAALTAAALAGPPRWSGVVLEALGPMGAQHQGTHEKSDAYDAATWELLSVCCCPACAAAQELAGADPVQVRRLLRAAVLDAGGGPAPRAAEALGGLAAAVLAARHAGTAALVTAVGRVLEGVGPVLVHGRADPWATGASSAVTPEVAALADAVVVPAWGASGPAEVAAARALGVEPAAYTTVLPPTDPADLPGHRAALRAAGATAEHVYHLGLAPNDRVALLAADPPGGDR